MRRQLVWLGKVAARGGWWEVMGAVSVYALRPPHRYEDDTQLQLGGPVQQLGGNPLIQSRGLPLQCQWSKLCKLGYPLGKLGDLEI